MVLGSNMHHFVHNRHGIKVVGQDVGSWASSLGGWVDLEMKEIMLIMSKLVGSIQKILSKSETMV